ncbi:MAG: arsenate reductase ArsC [Desulfobaccales bacterium]
MVKTKVLFVCIHNSARSQMAEALLKSLGGDRFEVESAGIEPGTLNPLAVASLKEVGIDIAGHGTQSVFELFKESRLFHYVITVCDTEAAERCPIFPGVTQRLHWSFPDPSGFQGSWEDKVDQTREVREQIKAAVQAWMGELSAKAR